MTPSQMATSPTLNTVWPGNQSGVAKMSPSSGRRGCVSTAELLNWSVPGFRPDARSAAAEAGSVPPLITMTSPLSAPPAPMSHAPGC